MVQEPIEKTKIPQVGEVQAISGPVVTGKIEKSIRNLMMNEIVFVGEEKVYGEISSLSSDVAKIQVYEELQGLERGAPIFRTGTLLSAELGPGLLGGIYDGLQIPVDRLMEETGVFIQVGVKVSKLDRKIEWDFESEVEIGQFVSEGDILGRVQENDLIEHKILAPPGIRGEIVKIAEPSAYSVDEELFEVESTKGEVTSLSMIQSWPVKKPRPFNRKRIPSRPLITGQRVLDVFFPIAKGGTVAITGGFGTGKTVLHHQLIQSLNSDIMIYVGCGERGNEVADLLQKIPKFKDKEGNRLLDKTILISNTSNMPVAAREASVYTGITLAEYYRDMGYSAALLVDSTSRWAEALREVSNRMGEMPGEGGYPAYLASRIAEFYGRSGEVDCLGHPSRSGSVSVVASVSPSGGDFSEPVTQKTLQIVRAFWGLDPELAYERHFPAVSLEQSFSFYDRSVEPYWYENISEDWLQLREQAMILNEERTRLERIVRLVGTGALSEKEKIILGDARLLDEVFLKQNAFDKVDAYCAPRKQYQLLDLVTFFHELSLDAVERDIPSDFLLDLPLRNELEELKYIPDEDFDSAYKQMRTRIKARFLRILREHT